MGGGGFRGGGGGWSGGGRGWSGGGGWSGGKGWSGNRGGGWWGGGNRGWWGGNRGCWGCNRGFGFWGLGLGTGFYGGYGGYWPYSSFDYGYTNSFDYYPAYGAGYGGGYGGYQQPGSNVVVVYPQQSPGNSVYIEQPAVPALHTYDEYGQEVRPGPSQAPRADTDYGAVNTNPALYLVAFRDGSILAAVAYWVSGDTLHFVTVDHVERTKPLSQVDRDMSLRLNRERRVSFTLPSVR